MAPCAEINAPTVKNRLDYFKADYVGFAIYLRYLWDIVDMKKNHLKGKSVAIVAMGRSHVNYTVSVANGLHFDEVWVINAMALMLKHDRMFMLDPASRFLDGNEAGGMTKNMRDYLKAPTSGAPIYTCELDDRCPTLELYPLKEVLGAVKHPYFNSTVSYAMGYAIYREVGSVAIYGADYTYARIKNFAEAGRACLEYWMGVARMMGINVSVAPESSLLDSSTHPTQKLYGYHRLDDPMAVVDRNGELAVGKASSLQNEILLWEQMKTLVSPNDPND